MFNGKVSTQVNGNVDGKVILRRLALCNTKLLRMCAEDRRVRLLVFAVRYWGKWKQVAGNQNCGPRLSNYCLSLLVLFYLANTTPPVLPSVQSLADLAGELIWLTPLYRSCPLYSH